jgi:hypothetical protein
VTFESFGKLLAFAKAKAGSKAQPNKPYKWCRRVQIFYSNDSPNDDLESKF